MIKNFDSEGRILIPKEIRKTINIDDNNNSVRIESINGMIILTNPKNTKFENKLIENKIELLKSMISKH